MGLKRSFVNGCFDILHLGHIRFMEYASSFGVLTVGINDDASVRKIKGDKRPINSIQYRMEMLYALRCVTHIFPFSDRDPTNLLEYLYSRGIGPDKVIKGMQYKTVEIPERFMIESCGGQILFYDSGIKQSTTSIINDLSRRSHHCRRIRFWDSRKD